MFDRQIFVELIDNPQKLSLDDIMNLENVLKSHPYFQLGHVLMAKAVHIKAPEISKDAMRKAAAYSLNRNALRKIIENEIDWVSTSSYLQASKTMKNTDSMLLEDELTRERLEENLIESISSPNIKNVQDEQTAIIERFIKEEPRISPIRKANSEESEEDLSEQSTTLASPLATESYAIILTNQERFERAIEVYRKLIAKNPEKSTYFASKIEELYQMIKG